MEDRLEQLHGTGYRIRDAREIVQRLEAENAALRDRVRELEASRSTWKGRAGFLANRVKEELGNPLPLESVFAMCDAARRESEEKSK